MLLFIFWHVSVHSFLYINTENYFMKYYLKNVMVYNNKMILAILLQIEQF
jgi:hypothetical protein